MSGQARKQNKASECLHTHVYLDWFTFTKEESITSNLSYSLLKINTFFDTVKILTK